MTLDKHANLNSIDSKADVEQIEERFSVEETQEYVIDPAEERRLLRKIDMRVMPIVCIVYLFACAYPFLFCCLGYACLKRRVRPRQDEPRERPVTGPARGCPRWGPDRRALRLGQLRFFLLIRASPPPFPPPTCIVKTLLLTTPIFFIGNLPSPRNSNGQARRPTPLDRGRRRGLGPRLHPHLYRVQLRRHDGRTRRPRHVRGGLRPREYVISHL